MNGFEHNSVHNNNAVRVLTAMMDAFNLNEAACEALKYTVRVLRDETRRAMPPGWSAGELRKAVENLEKIRELVPTSHPKDYNGTGQNVVRIRLASEIMALKFLHQRMDNPQTLTLAQDETMNNVVGALQQLAAMNDGVVGPLSTEQAKKLADDALQALTGLWDQLTTDTAERTASASLDAQVRELTMLQDRLRDQARRGGSMHSWWDVVTDIDLFLAGKPSILKFNTFAEWIEYAKKLLDEAAIKHVDPASLDHHAPAKYELGKKVLLHIEEDDTYVETRIMERMLAPNPSGDAIGAGWRYRTNDGSNGDIWYREDQIYGPAP